MITVDKRLSDDVPLFAQSGTGEDRSVCTVGDLRWLVGQVTRLLAVEAACECETAEWEMEKRRLLHKYNLQNYLVSQLVAQLKSVIDSKLLWAGRANAKVVLEHMEEMRGLFDE